MSRTSTKTVNFNEHVDRKESELIFKLMMACNDMQRANEALSIWRENTASSLRAKQVGAMMYFVRMQIGHLFEGLKVIADISNNDVLLKIIQQSDRRTKQSFEYLQQCLPNGSRSEEFKTLAGRVRHNLAFHYDETGKLIQRAISKRASSPDSTISTITRGDTVFRWHLKVADDLVDSIVCRQIWKIPYEANFREEADKITDKIHEVYLKFMDFSGEIIWKYFK